MSDNVEATKHVLVIEDEPDFSVLIASILRKQGYDVATASNGEEGLLKVKERTPDLITLDLQMPKKGGLRFYREVKSNTDYRHIPIVVITGVTRDDPDMANVVRPFLETEKLPSPEAMVEKPFDNQELVGIVKKALGET